MINRWVRAEVTFGREGETWIAWGPYSYIYNVYSLICLVGKHILPWMPETAHFWKDSKRQEFLLRVTPIFDFLKCASETKTEIERTPVTLPSCSHRTGASQSSSNVNGQEKEGSGSSLDPMTRCTLGTLREKRGKLFRYFIKVIIIFKKLFWTP